MKRKSMTKERGEKPKKSKYERKEQNRNKGILSDTSPLPNGVRTVHEDINGKSVKIKTVGE